MKIKIEDHWNFLIYILAGALDEHWAKKFKKRLLFEIEEKTARRQGGFDVILDMAGVTAVSKDGGKVLEGLNRILGEKGIGLAVCKLEVDAAAQMASSSAFPEERIFPSIFAAELALSGLRNE